MITIDDYKNLLDYFEVNAIPENLNKFVEKLRIMYEEILYREEVQGKLNDFNEQLKKLSEEKKED